MNDFCQRTNVYEKLRVALENLKNGGGLEAMFGDLEHDRVTVDFYDNGETIFMSKHHFPTEKPVVNEAVLPLVETQAEDTMQYNEENKPQIEVKPKRKRTNKSVGDTESENT
jgi:hypothetical protein